MSEYVQIEKYNGAGYKPIIDFEAWRVAIINWVSDVDKFNGLERHLETDEVFVLLKGKVLLIAAGNESSSANGEVHNMEQGLIYNIPKGVWHAIVMSKDATLLIVENSDTSGTNSVHTDPDSGTLSLVSEAVKKYGFDL